MSAQNLNWAISHFDALAGAVPAPGREWTFADSDLDRAHLMQLSERGLISRVDYDCQSGTVWKTSQQVPTLLEEAAESRDVDVENTTIVIMTPRQASFDDFAGERG